MFQKKFILPFKKPNICFLFFAVKLVEIQLFD